MRVLANYLTSSYIKPKMRAIGAYSGDFQITDNGGFKINVTRVSNVNDAVKQIKKVTAFLRNTTPTQSELDASIIAVINELDNTFLYSNTASADFYYNGFTKESYLNLRKEILSTTGKDIKAYADVLDKMLAKNYIIATGNTSFINSFPITFHEIKDKK